MDLEQIGNILKSIQHKPYEDGLYTNNEGSHGYRAVFNVGKHWYWYTVSGTAEIVPPSEVAEAINKGLVSRRGAFKVNGFEATISFNGRWYMLNAGSDKP